MHELEPLPHLLEVALGEQVLDPAPVDVLDEVDRHVGEAGAADPLAQRVEAGMPGSGQRLEVVEGVVEVQLAALAARSPSRRCRFPPPRPRRCRAAPPTRRCCEARCASAARRRVALRSVAASWLRLPGCAAPCRGSIFACSRVTVPASRQVDSKTLTAGPSSITSPAPSQRMPSTPPGTADRDLAVREIVQARGDDGRAGAGAAGEGLAHAALPDAHLDRSAIAHAHDLDIGAVREQRVMLDRRPDPLEVERLDRLTAEHHGVRVAHRDERDAVLARRPPRGAGRAPAAPARRARRSRPARSAERPC